MSIVSVIVPFYNCRYIEGAIDSLLKQTYPHVEIVVVNDGSNKYNELIQPYKQKITYIEKNNGGTASALNAGISQATGDYFTWLSSDDLYLPSKIERQLSFMKKTGADISYMPAQRIGTAGLDYFEKIERTPLAFLQALKEKCIINGCTVMMKMDVFSRIGLFDEKYRYTHDYEMWLRAAQQYDFYYLPEVLVQYRVHEEMGSKRFKEEIIQELKWLRRAYDWRMHELIAAKAHKDR